MQSIFNKKKAVQKNSLFFFKQKNAIITLSLLCKIKIAIILALYFIVINQYGTIKNSMV